VTSNLVLMLLMFVAGGLAATQSAVNARLSGLLGSPVQASFVSFCVGSLALCCILLLGRGGLPSLTRVVQVPPLYLVGGLFGVVFICLKHETPRAG